MKKIILSSYENSHNNSSPVYYWNGFGNSKYYISNFIEKNKDQIRNEYLKFIENIDAEKPGEKKIRKIFGINKFHNLWHMSAIYEKCPNKSLAINDCIKLIAFEKILDIENPKIVSLDSKNVNLHKSIKILCLRKKIIFENNLNLPYFFYLDSKSLIPNFLKTIIFIFKIFLSSLSRGRNLVNNNFENHISFISYFINFKIKKDNDNTIKFFSDYWHNLPDLIFQYDKKINWLHFGINRKAPKEFKILKNKKELLNSAKISHLLIDNYISIKIFIQSLIIFLNVSIKSLITFNIKKMFDLKNSNINFYTFLKNDWITSTRGSQLFYSIIIIKILDKLFSKIPKQKLGFYLLEYQSWERALIGSWKKFNHGKIIGVEHTSGYMRYWDLRFYKSIDFYKDTKNLKFMNDFTCINGPKSKELLICSGYPKNKIIEVEALRFNYLNKHIDKLNPTNFSSNKILLIGDIDYISTKNLLEDIKKIYFNLEKDIKIYFRPHPGTPNKQILINFAESLSINISEKPLISDINYNDKIIIVGGSSVSIEALLMNKTTIIYLNKNKLNLSPINFIHKINFVSNSQDLLSSINSNLKNRNSKQEFFWLDDNLPKWKIFLDKQLNY